MNHKDAVHHEIEWEGHFEQYGAKTPVFFQNMTLGSNGKISGGGKDDIGEFIIEGTINGAKIHFDKAYKGAHTVKYGGDLNGSKITGNWDLCGMTGSFEIRMKTKQWKGWFEQYGQKTDMLVSIDIKEIKGRRCPLRGIGHDTIGNYTLEGFKPIMGEGHTVMFIKKYFDHDTKVHYGGIIGNFGGEEKIRGRWSLGNDGGDFELVKQP